MTQHLVRVPDRIIRQCVKWEETHCIVNKYTSHGIQQRSPAERAAHKMCEFAFAFWAGVGFSAVRFGPDDGTDIDVGGILVDVKCCVMQYDLLLWPFNKIETFDTKKFDRLVLVKHNVPLFEVVGWIEKERFRRDRLVATDDSLPRLAKGTRYLNQRHLHKMDDFGVPATNGLVYYDDGLFQHYCQCGRWGAFGVDVSPLKGQFGTWYCSEHRPCS